jgi:AraC-like DNA-binding protein
MMKGVSIPAPPQRGWLTVKEVAERLRFTVTAPACPDEACRAFLRRQGVTPLRRGRINLFSSVDIDRLLTKGL